MKLILGSSSFLRQTLMKEAGYAFEIRTADITLKEIEQKLKEEPA